MILPCLPPACPLRRKLREQDLHEQYQKKLTSEDFMSFVQHQEHGADMFENFENVAKDESHHATEFYGLSQLLLLVQYLQHIGELPQDLRLIMLSYKEEKESIVCDGAYVALGRADDSYNARFLRNLTNNHYEFFADVLDPRDVSGWPTYSDGTHRRHRSPRRRHLSSCSRPHDSGSPE